MSTETRFSTDVTADDLVRPARANHVHVTEVIKAKTDAEFLSMVPTLAGYVATNSLVCVAFVGNRAGAAFRMSLPARRRMSDYRVISTWVIGALSRMPGVDGAVPVIYSDSTFASESGIPWLEFSRQLTERLHNEGFWMAGAFCVASDGWGNYFDRELAREGRSLDQISVDASVPSIDLWGTLPEVSESERAHFADALTYVESGEWPSELGPRDEKLHPLTWVEMCLDWQPGMPVLVGAYLVDSVQSPSVRDVAAIQIAFGAMIAHEVHASNQHYLDLQHRRGGTMDDIVQEEIAAGRSSLEDDRGSLLLMGRGALRPDRERVRKGVDLLRRVIALAPDSYRPAPLCILAWLLWSLGLSSAAGAHIEQALAIDPEYGMAQILNVVTANGRLPEWAFSG